VMSEDNTHTAIKTVRELLLKSVAPDFWKNCKANRRRGSKICQECPFRTLKLLK